MAFDGNTRDRITEYSGLAVFSTLLRSGWVLAPHPRFYGRNWIVRSGQSESEVIFGRKKVPQGHDGSLRSLSALMDKANRHLISAFT